MRGRLPLLGLAVSVVFLAGIVWWAVHQPAPQLPSSPGRIADLLGAILLYAIATVVRSERWHALLCADGAEPRRADSYALTVVGYCGNNVLPARAGDAVRVVLMTPRARTSARTVIGTLVAERLLDVAVILALFLVVGYAVLGNVGSGDLEVIGLITLAGLAFVAAGIVAMRRNRRLHALVAPMLSSTLGLRGRHGTVMLALTIVIWLIECFVWMTVGAAAGLDMSFLEGVYLVALASVFSMIPSGPAYAGTQDTAAIVGIKAIGGSNAIAVAYLLVLRFVLQVPITAVGFVLLAARYGGVSKLRSAVRQRAAADPATP